MTFSWAHFLTLAARLIDSPQTQESEHRTAIGRAYYAAYCSARDFAVTRGLQYQGNKPSHEQVWQFFRNAPSSLDMYVRAEYKRIGDDGLLLREQRTKADYKPFPGGLPMAISRADAETSIALSTRIFQRLRKLP